MKVISFKQFLTEDKEGLKFNLEDSSRGYWWKIIEKARDKFKIFFDMENCDSSSKGVEQYKTNGKTYLYQQWWSSGDWETPSILFCCQRINYKGIDPLNYGFAFIPNDKQGNPQLEKNDKGNLVPLDDQDKIKADPILGEKSLKEYLDKL